MPGGIGAFLAMGGSGFLGGGRVSAGLAVREVADGGDGAATLRGGPGLPLAGSGGVRAESKRPGDGGRTASARGSSMVPRRGASARAGEAVEEAGLVDGVERGAGRGAAAKKKKKKSEAERHRT